MSNGIRHHRATLSPWEWVLRKLHIVTLGSLFGDTELALPISILSTPAYLVQVGHPHELLLVTTPSGGQVWGLHTIMFTPPYGFFWCGDFYDEELPAPWAPEFPSRAEVTQVDGGGSLAFLQFRRPLGPEPSIGPQPALTGIRVYRTNYWTSPSAEFLQVLHQSRVSPKVFDMYATQDWLFVLTRRGVLHWYRQLPTHVQEFGRYNFQHAGKKSAVMLSHDMVMLVDNNGAYFYWLQPGAGFFTYPMPTVPTEEPFGNRSKRLRWYGHPALPPCRCAYLLLTGNGRWLRLYYLIEGVPELAKFRLPDGSLEDRYTFPEGYTGYTNDWDVAFAETPASSPAHERGLKLIRATTEGVKIEHLHLWLYPGAISSFEVGSRESVTDDVRRCVIWNHGSPNRGYFSADAECKLYHSYRLSG